MVETKRASAAVLAAALLVIVLHPAPAVADEAVVGTATLSLADKATGRKVTSELWFEAVPGSRIEGFSPRPPLRSVAIARNAEPASLAKRPLVVISHGNWGSPFSQGWLALALVRSGYVVLATSHPGTVGDDQTAAGRYRLWDRSRDVTFALNEVLRQPGWRALIDESRIGFVGHSFGGWTGVSLAGGRYDPARQRASCAQAARKDFYCEGTLKDDVAGIPAADAGASFRDRRFKAFYIMASGPGQGFAADSLAAIDVPFIVDTAQHDDILEATANSTALARQIAGAREVVRPVGHFTYVPECRWLIGPLLARVAGVPLCDDPQGVDRGALHRQVAPEVAAFFDKALGRGD